MINKRETKKGFGLVEVIVSASIVALIVSSVVSAYIFHFRVGLDTVSRVQATLLAEEGIEVVKFLRDESWNSKILPLALNTDYFLYSTSSVWQATTTEITLLNKFKQTIRFSDVKRLANGDISESTGTVDSGTRKITTTVSWPLSTGTTTKSISAYVHNLYNN